MATSRGGTPLAISFFADVTLHSNAGKCAFGSRYCTQFPEFAELFVLKSRTESDARKKDSVIFVLVSRTNFSRNFVRVLCATLRVTLHSNRGKCTMRPRYCTQIAEFRARLYSNRGQSGWERTPHNAALCPRRPRPPSPIVATFAFKSRTKFVANVVRDLTTNVRYFSAMTLQ
jgi:hypothetical protein